MSPLALELEECLPAASAPSAEEQWELEQVAAAVERWLGRQSARDRALFLRRYFAGWPVGELAGQLGLRPNAAAQRLRRLRQSLARALEEEGAVVSRWSEDETGPRRREYQVTEQGIELAEQWLDALRQRQHLDELLVGLLEGGLAGAGRRA